MKNYFIILGVLVIILISVFAVKQNSKINKIPDIVALKVAGRTVRVELALTEQAKEQGLSGRSGLLENTGMLFIFNIPDTYQFWMKDMNFPIDIIWLAGKDPEHLHVIYIKKNADPKLYPETYGPITDAEYVLEVQAGFSDKNNLKVGDPAIAIYK